MKKTTVFPHIGQLLRTLIKTAGYRSALVELGLDKNLDDLAMETENRQSSRCEVLQGIEDAVSKTLAADCGDEWAQFLRQVWFRTRESLQALVQAVDVSPLDPETGGRLLMQEFEIPMVSGFANLSATIRRGPAPASLLANPLQAWLEFVEARTGVPKHTLMTNLANEADADPRTVERWLSGDPIGKVSWPYAPKVAAAIGKSVAEPDLHLLTGWLLVACALQSVPFEVRDAAGRELALQKQQPWTLGSTAAKLSQESHRQREQPGRREAVALLTEVQQLFPATPREDNALHDRLVRLQKLIGQFPALRPAYQHIHDWFAARHAALLGEKNTAVALYASSVSGAWWRAGQNLKPILTESLMYAVGISDKDAANAYWDKTFMLGLNRWPKRTLDEQEMRRIAFGFERYFHPQKAKDRIPPPVEFRTADNAFHLSTKHLARPNQKTKYAEGRVRRTALMMAIQEGKLDEVKELIAAGGNPNDFVPESGEGPLSYAMRRACDRKDASVMDYLLGLQLSKETVNRSASTKREIPLKLAVEMGNAGAVSRLIALGANVEAACDHLPSVLCYAMALFHENLHRDDLTQQLAYAAGKTRADVYDAKEGAVLDVDLAARRQRQFDLAHASERHQQMWKAVRDYFYRSPEDYRNVIRALLAGGAKANCRYRVEPHQLEEWTPTLFAAQVGDLDVFRMLVEHSGENRGDPTLTLTPPTGLKRLDALWVAVSYGQHAIVSYLQGQENEHAYGVGQS